MRPVVKSTTIFPYTFWLPSGERIICVPGSMYTGNGAEISDCALADAVGEGPEAMAISAMAMTSSRILVVADFS